MRKSYISYSAYRHRNKISIKEKVEWIIRYLPKQKISLCVSTDDVFNDENLLTMAQAKQALATRLDVVADYTVYKKPNFVDSIFALMIAWGTSIGFIIFSVVSFYLTGKFNIYILSLTIMGVITPIMALQTLRMQSKSSQYTMCNPNPTMPEIKC